MPLRRITNKPERTDRSFSAKLATVIGAITACVITVAWLEIEHDCTVPEYENQTNWCTPFRVMYEFGLWLNS